MSDRVRLSIWWALVVTGLLLTGCSGGPGGTVEVQGPRVVEGGGQTSAPAEPGQGAPQTDPPERSVRIGADGTLVASGDQASFVMPSGNIQCVIRTDSVVCQIAEKDFRPDQGHLGAGVLGGCDAASADALTLLVGSGAGWTCTSETIRGQAAVDLGGWWAADGMGRTEEVEGRPLAVLSYGRALQVGSMLCRSERTGISCRDLTTTGGFTLAREAYTLK